MIPNKIIDDALVDGVALSLSATGRIKAVGDQDQIARWLPLIRQHKEEIIASLREAANDDKDVDNATEVLDAEPWPKEATPIQPDDRRTCDQCANLIARRCQAAKRGEIVASRNYEPIRDLPRRCEGYAPVANDPDRRPGRERWPELTNSKGTK